MVGGKVVETIYCEREGQRLVWINVVDRPRTEQCAIYVADSPAARSVSEGDNIWWQGVWAMWTPKGSSFSEYKLVRRGGSGVNRPPASEHIGPTTEATGARG